MTSAAFRVGDLVRIKVGKFAGRIGLVHRAGRDHVTVRLRHAGQWWHVGYKAASLELDTPRSP